MVRQRYELISIRDIYDQRILESDWSKSTPGLTQPRVVGFMLPFLNDYLHAKN